MSTTTEHQATTPRTGAVPATPATYRAAVVHSFHEPLSLDEVPAVKLAAGQVRVKVEASGLCHTDIHAAHGDWPVRPSPPSRMAATSSRCLTRSIRSTRHR